MKPLEQKYGQLNALLLSPSEKPERVLVLLHGVGGNEHNLLELGPRLAPKSAVISLRAPLTLGAESFAWFQVQFRPEGPVHDREQAKASLKLLNEALNEVARKTGVPLSRITVFGFSQGAIMTLGLALRSELPLQSYVAIAGRTLPEFSEEASKNPIKGAQSRRVLLAHGALDSKLPLAHAKNSERVLRGLGFTLTYKEYPAEHGIPESFIADAKGWFESL